MLPRGAPGGGPFFSDIDFASDGLSANTAASSFALDHELRLGGPEDFDGKLALGFALEAAPKINARIRSVCAH